MPTVSVIVPNYNHAAFLEQRIESILNQTFHDFELILVDDGSSDGSRTIMEHYRSHPQVSHIVFGDRNSGSAFLQWNNGIALAQGEWLWIAESDDYAEPIFLERLLNESAKVPHCTLAYTATFWVDRQGRKLWETPHSNTINVYRGKEFIHKKLAVHNSIANVSECLFRRDAFRPEECHRYEQMRLCGDWFLYVLLAEKGNVVEMGEPLSYYRQHSTNISSDAEQQGLTFLEGVNVLDYMIHHCGLKRRQYARGWGRLWARYEKQYHFHLEVKKKVNRRIGRQYPEIAFYKQLYTLFNRTK